MMIKVFSSLYFKGYITDYYGFYEKACLPLFNLRRMLYDFLVETRKAQAPFKLRQTDKKSPEKSGLVFLGNFVLVAKLEIKAQIFILS
jgi:hypothetical protein